MLAWFGPARYSSVLWLFTLSKKQGWPFLAHKICQCKHSISELSNLHYIYCNTVCVGLSLWFNVYSVYSEAGEWTVQLVLRGNDLTSENYQDNYQSLHNTRIWWKDQLTDYPTEKEIQLQRYIQSLHQELQVSHETKVSLQEALVEANKQGIYTNTLTDYYRIARK